MELTPDRLHEALEYDPDTGLFRWLISSSNKPIGRIAGGIKRGGYRWIGLDGREYSAARLVWFYIHERWPHGEIDHIDRNRSNNRLANLREGSRSQNHANMVAAPSNKSGFKGVSFNRQKCKWMAQIKQHQRGRFLGYFHDPAEAHQAYAVAAKELFGAFARTS